MSGSEGGVEMGDKPVRRREGWFRENSNSPPREISAQLLGIPTSTVGRYWGEMRGNSGVLASPRARGPPQKRGRNRNTRTPAGRRHAIQHLKKRMLEARAGGRINTSRNLTRWETEGEEGLRLPMAGGGRFPRKVFARLGSG